MVSLRTSIIASSIVLALPGAAAAAVTEPVAIPAVAKAQGKSTSYTVKGGTRLTVSFKPNKRGAALRKKLAGKEATLMCTGFDKANTSALLQISTSVRIRKTTRFVRGRLKTPMVVKQCGLGASLVELDLAQFPKRVAQYDAQFAQLVSAAGYAFDALIALVSGTPPVDDPSLQQIVDTMKADTSYKPPFPLVPLTTSTEFPAAGSLGIWYDSRTLRANLTHADGQPLAGIMDFSGIR